MTITTEVRCSCGKLLDTTENFNTRNDTIKITSEPCESCIKDAKDEAEKEGYERGFEESKEKREKL